MHTARAEQGLSEDALMRCDLSYQPILCEIFVSPLCVRLRRYSILLFEFVCVMYIFVFFIARDHINVLFTWLIFYFLYVEYVYSKLKRSCFYCSSYEEVLLRSHVTRLVTFTFGNENERSESTCVLKNRAASRRANLYILYSLCLFTELEFLMDHT